MFINIHSEAPDLFILTISKLRSLLLLMRKLLNQDSKLDLFDSKVQAISHYL
jgi:hypothetical protein